MIKNSEGHILNKRKKIIVWLCIIITILLIFSALGIKEKVYKAIYPIRYEAMVNYYAEEFEIDPLLVYAIIKIESNFNEKAESKKRCNWINAINGKYSKRTSNEKEYNFSKRNVI